MLTTVVVYLISMCIAYYSCCVSYFYVYCLLRLLCILFLCVLLTTVVAYLITFRFKLRGAWKSPCAAGCALLDPSPSPHIPIAVVTVQVHATIELLLLMLQISQFQ